MNPFLDDEQLSLLLSTFEGVVDCPEEHDDLEHCVHGWHVDVLWDLIGDAPGRNADEFLRALEGRGLA